MTTTDLPATSAPPDPRETLAAELHDLAVRSACGDDFPPYDSLSEESRKPWRDMAGRIMGDIHPQLAGRLRFAEVMERSARRHAAQCDLDVAEADAHAARLKAEVARVREMCARQGLEMHDLRDRAERLGRALQVCEHVLHRVEPTAAETHAAQQAAGAWRTDWRPEYVHDDLPDFQYRDEAKR